MRPEFEYDVFVMNSPDMQEALPVMDYYLPGVEPAKAAPAVEARGKTQWRRRPSATLWRFILVSVDTLCIILLSILTFILVPFIHLNYRILANLVNGEQGGLICLCFVFVCWNFAVRITRAQDLNFASNYFRSAFCSFLALLLLCLLSVALVNPLMGIDFEVSIQVGVLFLLVASPIIIVWRVLFALMLNLPRFRRRAVIVGINPAGQRLVETIQNLKRSTLNVIGYIGEESRLQAQSADPPVLGSRNALRSLVEHRMIDMIIMAIDYQADMELFQEAIDASRFGIAVIPAPVIFESVSGKIPVKLLGDQWYAALPLSSSHSPLYLLWDKILNVAFSICGFLFLLLILPVVTLLIYLESPGPVFYTQERLGFQGKPLRIYKFRSMRINAESDGHAVWAARDDPRITRFGRFMRTTHLDELPQVINILRGEMNLIGPRPERAEFVNELEKTIPFYRCRLAAKPGLTGWAQVKYSYGNTDHDALVKLQYDLYYIKHRSFILDVFIILNTVVEVLQRHGV